MYQQKHNLPLGLISLNKILFGVLLIFSFILGAHLVLAFDVPSRPNGYVLDQASLLGNSDKQMLEQNLENFQKETSDEIAVVIINSLGGDTVENVAQEIFTKWGIGKKGQDNGALLLVSKDDHSVRIHVGYGLEPTLTDIVAHNIEENSIIPKFKSGEFASGITDGVNAIEQVVRDPSQAENYNSASNGSSGSGNSFMFFIFFGLMILQWMAAILARSKSWWAGGVLGGIVGGLNMIFLFISSILFINIIIFFGLIGFGLLFDYLVSKKYQKNKSLGIGHPWWIGGGGFGGGSGFGGFGGGGSGGGGASGSW